LRRLKAGPGIDWLIAEVIPETDFAQPIYGDMRTTAIVVAFLLLLSGYAALLLARRVTSPLEALSGMARSLAAGDLSQTVRLEGTDEIGNLASSFNSMAAELRRSFASIAESESRYRAFVADTTAGIFRFETRAPMPLEISEEDQVDWFSRHFMLAECNEAAVRMLGHRLERDILGMDPGVWLPRSDPSSTEAMRALVRSAFQVASLECARPSRDGRMQWLLASVTGVVESGNLVRVWVVLRDISDRRKAELVREATAVVLDAAGLNGSEAMRVWVLIHEQPDGTWGAAGQIVRYSDLVALAQEQTANA